MHMIPFPNILLDALEIGVIIIDDAFTVRYWNKWLEINTGIKVSEIIGKNFQEFYPDIDYHVLARKIRTTLRISSPTFYDASKQNRFIEIPRTKITTSLLTTMQLQVIISPYVPSDSLVMISIYNISDQHELKLALQAQMKEIAHLNNELQRDKQIIDDNLLNIKTDAMCQIIEVSSAFLTFFGYKKEDLLYKPLTDIYTAKMLATDYQAMKECLLSVERWSGEIEIRANDGELHWVDAMMTPWIDEEGLVTNYTAIYHDISDKKRIELLAITDPLTKLFNRNKFNDVFHHMLLREHWTSGNSFALLIADIDYFKRVNDTYGHQIGDSILIKVAQLFQDAVRDGDMMARWGGEEFVFLLPNVNLEKAMRVAHKLRHVIADYFFEEVGSVTVSFGVSLYTVDDTSHSMIQRADSALYRAKEKGRNQVESEPI
jgi:diguanylate cyclase (GGDEF)-like protein/PAS domain S-box-containing protein